MAVDPNIQQKADYIRTRKQGSEVRESLASGLEAMSEDVVDNKNRQSIVESRQDSVESQWQNVVDETTGKDVISAPEIIAARNGKPNLKQRLDDENEEVTRQLAHTAKLSRAELHFIKTDIIEESGQVISYGASDCILIRIPSEDTTYNILVDTHELPNTTHNVIPYLNNLRITTLDYVILTHYHGDHVGGFSLLAENFEIKNVVLGEDPDFNHSYFDGIRTGLVANFNQVMNAIATHNLNIIYPSEYQILEVGEGKFTFFNTTYQDFYSATGIPSSSVVAGVNDKDFNNFNLLFYFEYGKTKAFFSGDLGAAGQKKFEDTIQQCDIYKVEHHGHNKFVNEKYLRRINPKIAVAQTLSDNFRGYQDKVTPKWLKANNIEFHSTMGTTVVVGISDLSFQLFSGRLNDKAKPTFKEFGNFFNIEHSGVFDNVPSNTITDFNQLLNSGFYVISSGGLNAPTPTGGYSIAVFSNSNRISQLAFLNDSNVTKLYHRVYGYKDASGYAWGQWRKVTTHEDLINDFATIDFTDRLVWKNNFSPNHVKATYNPLTRHVLITIAALGVLTADVVTTMVTVPTQYRPLKKTTNAIVRFGTTGVVIATVGGDLTVNSFGGNMNNPEFEIGYYI